MAEILRWTTVGIRDQFLYCNVGTACVMSAWNNMRFMLWPTHTYTYTHQLCSSRLVVCSHTADFCGATKLRAHPKKYYLSYDLTLRLSTPPSPTRPLATPSPFLPLSPFLPASWPLERNSWWVILGERILHPVFTLPGSILDPRIGLGYTVL